MKSLPIGDRSLLHAQTCNTSNAIAIATRMAVTRTFKILMMHNMINKSNLENAFLGDSDNTEIANIFDESGIDAMMKLAKTNQLSASNFKDYADILVPDRLELLPGTIKRDGQVRELMLEQISYIVNCAREAYEYVILDINAGYGELSIKTLNLADLLIVSLNQNMEVLRTYFDRKEWDTALENKPHLLVLGNYDETSEYDVDRIRKEFDYKGEMYVVPRNTRLMDAINRHDALSYFAGMGTKKVKGPDKDFIKCLDMIIDKIMFISKLDDINTYNPLVQKTLFDKMFGVFR